MDQRETRAQRALADLKNVGQRVARKPRPDERFRRLEEPRLIVEFTVPGPPVSKARPRLGRNGNTYTPSKTVRGEGHVQECCFVANPRLRPQPGRFRLYVDFYLPGGASRDVDNLQKLVQDALSGIVWIDDRYLAEVRARMEWFAAQPRTEILIWLVEVPERA
jgi:crossover junction endodeoxyribonuclease RusA